MKNGNSGSGAAAAMYLGDTIYRIHGTNAAAARRVFSLNELDMIVPLFVAPVSARRWGNPYRSTVSGRLHEIAKMVSSR
jgi:hypothetical protein